MSGVIVNDELHVKGLEIPSLIRPATGEDIRRVLGGLKIDVAWLEELAEILEPKEFERVRSEMIRKPEGK